ncbi:uncharacterized protein LOC131440237 [Malaya genurostris]|uniref:uncharacterized protein LOC131440237 n=1 Tax=Malaya genurostris TaxID=325434 RepID=UPI0026F3E002|nr:uncharacterized protein LOC131440237 [Malaya genurostris]
MHPSLDNIQLLLDAADTISHRLDNNVDHGDVIVNASSYLSPHYPLKKNLPTYNFERNVTSKKISKGNHWQRQHFGSSNNDHNSTLRTKGSARRSLNFQHITAEFHRNNERYERSTQVSSQRYDGVGFADDRTSNWVEEHVHIQNNEYEIVKASICGKMYCVATR